MMKYGIMESFRMHHTQMEYGLTANGDRVSLFSKAADLGFHGIELGIGLDYREDPLWTGEGDTRQKIKESVQKTEVQAASICLHLLNYAENSPASREAAHRETAREIIIKTAEACGQIGISVILVPFFGTAALKSEEQVQLLISEMGHLAPVAADNEVCLGLETALKAPDMVRIVESVSSDYVQVYFDTGNTAGIGYDVVEEIKGLDRYIVQTHIKDDPSTRMLGEGKIDFKEAIKAFKVIGFDGYLMLETPSTENSTSAAVKNLNYIQSIIENQ
jgi:sugar phosphate isomerase/epimerase